MISRLASGFRNEPVAQRLLRNLKWIFSSQVAVALLGMIYLAFGARALGAAGLGMLALVESYGRIIERLIHLEPWQAVIRNGSEALEAGDDGRLGRLVGLSVLLDLFGGVLAASVALLLVPVAAPWFGFDASQYWLLIAAAAAALISLRATGLALLRLYDRFDLLAKIDTAVAGLRAALAVGMWAAGFGLAGFVAIYVIVSLLNGTAALIAGIREMRRRNQQVQIGAVREALNENPGFLRLMWNSNLAVILRQTSQRFDVIILAALVPAASVGYYHVARRCGDVALRLGRPISQAIYPELTRFAARGELARIGRVVRGVSLGFAAVMIVVLAPVIWQLEPIVTTIFGDTFAPAVPVVAIQAVAVGFYMCGIVMNPALLSLDQDRAMVRIGATSTVLFFVLVVPMVKLFGVAGAAGTHLICNAIWLTLCVVILRKSLRQTVVVKEVSS